MRTEEEKKFDIIMHKKRTEARDICRELSKARRKAGFVAAALFIILFISLISTMLSFYDAEKAEYSLLILFGIGLITYAAYIAIGSIIKKSFIKLSALSRKFKDAENDLRLLEEKNFQKSAYAPDIEKAEKKLLIISDKIIALK